MGATALPDKYNHKDADQAVGGRLHARWEQLGSALIAFVNRRQLEKEGFHLDDEEPLPCAVKDQHSEGQD